MESMTIGQIARLSGVGVETVRFYERERLLPRPPRRRSGYRDYPPNTLDRLAFIRNAKELGFSLREIRELLSLRVDPRTNCDAVRVRGQSKLDDIEGKIRNLERMRAALAGLLRACDERRATGPCPLLEALDHDEP